MHAYSTSDLGQNYLTTIGLAELAELVNLEIL